MRLDQVDDGADRCLRDDLPVGLCGFVSDTSFVRGVISAATRSGSTAQPSS